LRKCSHRRNFCPTSRKSEDYDFSPTVRTHRKDLFQLWLVTLSIYASNVKIPRPSLPFRGSHALHPSKRDASWFVAHLSSVLAAVPDTLKEICITYGSFHPLLVPRSFAPVDDPFHSWFPVDSLAPQTITAVESAILNSAVSPRVRWRLDPPSNAEAWVTEFVTSLPKGMPTLHEQGRFIIEQYSSDDEDLGFWATNDRFSD